MDEQLPPSEPIAVVPSFVRFSSSQFETLEGQAKKKWQDNVLGPRPTKKSVRATLPNEQRITLLQWMAILLLLVLTVFTSIKVGISAGPYVNDLVKHLVTGGFFYVAQGVINFLILTTMVLVSMMATPGLVYFQLLRDDPEIRRQQALHPFIKHVETSTLVEVWQEIETSVIISDADYALKTDEEKQKYKRIKQRQAKTRRHLNIGLDSISPRLPILIVWGITVWLLWVGNLGGNNIFLQNLPVIVEIGLAHLVGNIIDQMQLQNRVIQQAWERAVEPYDTALKTYRNQPSYISILYNLLRDAAPKLRNGRVDNSALLIASQEDVNRFIKDEYRRHTANDDFAKWVIAENEARDRALEELGEVQQQRPENLRVPLGGQMWTADALFNDLIAWGAPVTFNRNSLNLHYDPAYKAHEAWRNGAKSKFLAHHNLTS